MSRQQVVAQYTRLLARWPKDVLRPETNFQQILRRRTEAPPITPRNEVKELTSAFLLLDNAFARQYALPKSLMKPASSPDHYTNLKRELEEAPNRSWFANFAKRMKNLVRFI